MSMLDAQIALRRCGFTAEQEAILYDSMEAGRGFHTKFEGGDHEKYSKGDMSATVAQAVEMWKNKNFKQFGAQMGEAMRDLTMEVYPEKYYVDADGRLKQRIVLLSSSDNNYSVLAAGPFGFCIVASVSLIFLVGLAVRSWRATTQRYREVDGEEALDLELAANGGVLAEVRR